MARLRLVFGAAALFILTPGLALASAFTVEFAVSWEFVTKPEAMGTGAIIGFVVDNGSLSPLNQTYLVTDVNEAFVDATAYGGTYNERFEVVQIDHEGLPFTLFTVSATGQAVIDFNQVGATTFYSSPPPGSLSQFSFQHTLNLWFTEDLIRFIEFEERCPCTPGGFSRTSVSNGQLVGSVPDSTNAFLLLAAALGCIIAARWRLEAISGRRRRSWLIKQG